MTKALRRIPLAIFQHELKGHPTRTAHWCLVALFSLQKATIFELVGNTDTYGYVCSETNEFHTSYPSLRGGVKVGSVPEDQHAIDWLKGILATIDIHKHDVKRFDCQFWVLAALKMLNSSELGGMKEHGVVLDGLNEAAIRMELLEERERWERGDDTFHEREYSI
ncbi:hypothetical protein Moror_15610 [Moniliophthora roreri MCA 2997]|uniref:Uncharacterized protein n=2 Tax=Moniliophthora roreri TaxID=221103 RepID=V2WP94_MONRO|nr:hypothetical protein Moror_15610 [Moniliophthora roreri MCA 2997]